MASILRTGKILRCFAGFTRNIVINSARENEAGNLLQNTTCICTQFQNGFANNAVPKTDMNLDKQIRRLDQDVRRIGRISRRDIEEILDEIRTQKTATSSQSLMMIRCCGNLVPEEKPEVRTALVQEIWKTLNALNVPMDISHYNALLRVYLENEHTFAPTDFLAEIESKGIEPNRVTYQRLITRYCQQGDIEGATRILEYMRAKNLPVNENVFNSLILGHSEANDLESAKGVLGVMKQAGLEPSADTYTTLLCAFARHGDFDSIKATLAECDKQEIILLDKDILDIIYTLVVHGNSDKVDELLPKLRISAGFNQDAVNVILRLVNKGHENVCLKLLRIMPRNARANGEPVDVGAFFIKQLVKANRPVEKIVSICKTLQSEGLNPKALSIATEAGLHNGIVNSTIPLLHEMKNTGLPIRQHYFWPLICAVESNQVLDIVRRMHQEFDLYPNSETIRDYVIPNMKEKNHERILTVLRDVGVPYSTAVTSAAYVAINANELNEAAKIMEQNRAFYAPGLFKSPLILALSKTDDYASFIRCIRQLWEGVINRQTTDNSQQQKQESATTAQASEEEISETEATETATPTQTAKTHANANVNVNKAAEILGSIVTEAAIYFRSNKVEVLEKILDGLVQEGLTISNASATRLSERLGAEMTPKISELLGKLSSGDLEPVPLKNTGRRRTWESMTVEELERFVANVEAKGENANNVRRHLIAACFRSQNLEKTLQVIQKLQNNNFNIPVGVWAQLIDLYTLHKRSADALAQYEKLKAADKDIKLDNLKTIRLASLLIQEDRIDDAIKLLEENKKQETFADSDGTFNYVSTVWRILNYVAEAGDAQKLQRIFDALETGNYIVPTNVLLGPLIKVHLVKDDLQKAIDTFDSICTKYKSTPWKNELACRLIQKEDAANLQRLTDLSTGIHGEINSLYDLVFAFVECGRVRQARKILETPGLRTRPQRINTACQRYKNEGMTQPLEGLIEATKDLGHIDRNNIYYTLLLSYEKTDDAEKALGLWTKMQEESVLPSDAFLIKLAELLNKKNIEVPFIVPDAKQSKENVSAAGDGQVSSFITKSEKSTEALAANEKKPRNSVRVGGSRLTAIRKAIQRGNVDLALANMNELGPNEVLNVIDKSRLIELLVRENRLKEATEHVRNMFAANTYPLPKICKYFLNKVAAAGDIELLDELGKKLTDEQKRMFSFDNRYCHANIVAGKAVEYIEKLDKEISAVKTKEEAAKLAEKFPRGGAMGILENHPELLKQYEKVAEQYAKHNQFGPVNVLWMHLVTTGDDTSAKEIWHKHLSNAPRLMFQRVFQMAREQKDEKMIESVITLLRESKISEGAIGNAYSCLIDIQVFKNHTDKAMDALKTALKDVSLENINRTALIRLKLALEEQKKEFPYTIPEKKSKLESSSSSSDSDDDVLPKQPETIPPKPERA